MKEGITLAMGLVAVLCTSNVIGQLSVHTKQNHFVPTGWALCIGWYDMKRQEVDCKRKDVCLFSLGPNFGKHFKGQDRSDQYLGCLG